MMAEDAWMGREYCGKRPRSPVDKLADLAAAVEDDEGDWKSNKRYLTEVIANGFSKLSVKLVPPQQQQQQPPNNMGPLDASAAALQQRRQPSISPTAAGHCLAHVPLAMQLTALPQPLPQPQPLQLHEQPDVPMDVQQMSPPTWPPQSQQQHLQRNASAAAAAAAPGGLAFGGAFAGGYVQQQQQGPCNQQDAIQPAAGQLLRSTPSPEGSPQSLGPKLYAALSAHTPPPATLGGAAAAGAAAGAASACCAVHGAAPAGLCDQQGLSAAGCSRPGLPPLQTAKGIRAAEKPPQSPSDLSSTSLRKVALLRSLLARAEQQFQQQQQQQPAQGKGQQQPSQQPSRLQPLQQQQQQQQVVMEGPAAARHSPWQQQQQQQQVAEGSSNRWLWGPPWPPAAAAAPTSNTVFGPQPLQQLSGLPPRPATPWELSSDDMDCSSAASSLLDSDGSSSLPGVQEASAELPAVGCCEQQDQAMSALLCREVLCGAEMDTQQQQQQQQQQLYQQQQQQYYQQQQLLHQSEPGLMSCREQQAMPLPFSDNVAQVAPLQEPVCAAAAAGASLAQSQQHQQQEEGAGGGMLAARRGSPELSRQKLEELRAKALASTKQLTCLTQEDLTSLQLGIVPRRSSCDSSHHAPSGLQQDSVHDAALRRHSSHL